MSQEKLKELKKSQTKARLRKADTFQRLFESNDGKLVLYDLMRHFHFMRSSYDKDPLAMAFKEVERNVLLYIMSALKVDIEEAKQYIEQAGGKNDPF